MKKICHVAALALLLAGCAKEENAPIPGASPCTVTLTLGTVASGSLTKGDDKVADLLDAHSPSGEVYIRLVSTSDNTRVYDAKPGKEIAIIPDTYKVTGAYSPKSVFDCFRGKFYLEPRFSIDTEITVTPDTDTYALPVSWNCFALVRDKTKVARFQVMDKNVSPADITTWTEDEGDLSLVFVHCTSAWEGDMYFRLTAYPADEQNYQPTSWQLVTKAATGSLLVKDGTWYCFTPEGTTAKNGSFSFTFPAWTAGSTE